LLPGREREAAFLNELLNRVRGGHSAAIVVHGEAGVGKTALLNDVVDSAPDLRVVRAAGVESEMELPFAGLQRPFPNARDASWRPPARRSEGRPRRGCTISPARRRRSPGSPAKD
jgi:AAA ATPase-like protein